MPLACFNAALLALGSGAFAIETSLDTIWSCSTRILQRSCFSKRPKASDTTHALFVSEKRIYVLLGPACSYLPAAAISAAAAAAISALTATFSLSAAVVETVA